MQQPAERPAPLQQLGIAARPTFLFVVAFALNATPHEAVHALTAWLFGLNSTVYQMWVNPDQAAATPAQLAVIAAAGPLFSLIAGVICLLLYIWRFRNRRSGLVLLMLALVGIDCFLGPMASAWFGGDFHQALGLVGAPPWIDLIVSAIGTIVLASFMFRMGWELEGWIPRQLGWFRSAICSTIAPPLVGTVLILALYSPLPPFLVWSTISGTIFWIFALAGALFAFRSYQQRRTLSGFTRLDAVLAIAAFGMVRIFAMGIRLAH